MFVQHPHDLGSIHCGTAAQSNDHIRCKGAHLLCTLLGAGQCRIRLYIREDLVYNAHFLKLIGDMCRHTALEQKTVCYQEGTLPMQNILDFTECYRQAALLKVHLLGRAEPQHIFSPLSYRLDIQQMFHAYVLRNRVTAPGTTAQCQGWKQLEVIQIANTALR